MEKSHVSMEQKVCVVCGKPYDTGSILLDIRLRESLDRHTKTGWGLCPEHLKLKEEGYVCLIEYDEDKSAMSRRDSIKAEDAYRTGTMVHIRKEVFERLFSREAPEGMVVFCDQKLIEHLKKMQKGEEHEEQSEQ